MVLMEKGHSMYDQVINLNKGRNSKGAPAWNTGNQKYCNRNE